MDFVNQNWYLNNGTAESGASLQNRYRQTVSPCLNSANLQFLHGSDGHLRSRADDASVMMKNNGVTNSGSYLPSPISASNQPSVFTFDIPVASTNSVPVYNPHSSMSVAGDKRPRAEAVERLLFKFPKLRHMLEDEEAIANKTTTTHFEPISCSTPTFYSGLQIPTINFTPSIASSFMDEECDVGYSSYTEQTAFAPTCSYEEELDSALADINLANIATTESQILHVLHASGDIFPPMYTQIEPDTNNDRAKHPCSFCSKTFVTKKNLNVHMRGHGPEKPHTCVHCGKGFAQKSSLRTHMRTHTGERPYKCSMCPKAFSDFSTYTKHNRTHTGERPYTCDICGKGFAQSGNMIRHRQVHQKNGH